MTQKDALTKLTQAQALLDEVRHEYSHDLELSISDADNFYFWLLGSITSTLHLVINRLRKEVAKCEQS